ncbi:MAG: Lrp/AsnC family transcriptional regulator [Promethearchaeota archaeon]
MKKKFYLDATDKAIINQLQLDPSITHSKIANILGLSQPAIGARIKKLTEKGLIATQIGVNFQKIPELNLLRVNMKTSRTNDVMELCEYCPFVINAIKSTGDYNMTIFMASRNLKHLDAVMDRHFRNKPYVSKIQMDLVTSMAKPIIFPLNMTMESMVDTDDPCKFNPLCAADREKANKRSPEELNLE